MCAFVYYLLLIYLWYIVEIAFLSVGGTSGNSAHTLHLQPTSGTVWLWWQTAGNLEIFVFHGKMQMQIKRILGKGD